MLTVENISKTLGTFALADICLSVNHEDYYVLVGESGAGKSLLLEIISGLVLPDAGDIWLNGRNITSAKIQSRGVGLVMQDTALFPHLSVFHNIAYPLKCRNEKVSKINTEVQAHSKKLNIPHLLDRKPYSLSGGEAQRVALARTLVSKPKIYYWMNRWLQWMQRLKKISDCFYEQYTHREFL